MMRTVIVIAACLAVASGLQSIATAGPTLVVSNASNIDVSCDQLRTMHHALSLARVGYQCPEKATSDNPTDCDRDLLADLQSCSLANSQKCFFEIIAQEKACFPTNEPGEVCNTLYRVTNALMYTQQAFCSDIANPNDDCPPWLEGGCVLGIEAAMAACAIFPPAEFACIVGFLGAAAPCVPCICLVSGICP